MFHNSLENDPSYDACLKSRLTFNHLMLSLALILPLEMKCILQSLREGNVPVLWLRCAGGNS